MLGARGKVLLEFCVNISNSCSLSDRKRRVLIQHLASCLIGLWYLIHVGEERFLKVWINKHAIITNASFTHALFLLLAMTLLLSSALESGENSTLFFRINLEHNFSISRLGNSMEFFSSNWQFKIYWGEGSTLYLKPIMAASGLCVHVGVPTHHYCNYFRHLSADPTWK